MHAYLKRVYICTEYNYARTMKQLFITFFLIFAVGFGANAQYHFSTSVTTNNGITMVIELSTTGIETSTPSGHCPNGYNFNVLFDYSVNFYKNGKERKFKDSDIYTLQGNFKCDDQSSFFDIPNTTGKGSGKTNGNIWVGESTCATATVESLICNNVEFVIQLKGYDYNSISVQGTSTLPIELITFDAVKQDRQVELLWKTASELNNDYFTIERSADGMSWENVQTVLGAGNSTRVLNYSWIDNSPYAGISYYRLTQTDYDGKSETFNIVSVEQNEVEELQAYPNPVSHTSSLIGVDSNKPVRIFNTVGVEVTGNIDISISPSKKTLLDMSNLPNGMYYVVNGDESIRLLKQ